MKIILYLLICSLFWQSAEAIQYNAFIIKNNSDITGRIIGEKIASLYKNREASKITIINLRTATIINSVTVDPAKEKSEFLKRKMINSALRDLKMLDFNAQRNRFDADSIGVFIDDISFKIKNYDTINLYLLDAMVTPDLSDNLVDHFYSDAYLFHPESNFKNLHKLQKSFSAYIYESPDNFSKRNPSGHKKKLYRFYSLLFRQIGAEKMFVFDERLKVNRFLTTVEPIDFSKINLSKQIVPKKEITVVDTNRNREGEYEVKVFNGTATVSATLPKIRNKDVVIHYDNADIKIYTRTDPNGRFVFRSPLHHKENSFKIINNGRTVKSIAIENKDVNSLIKVTLQWDTNHNDVDLHVIEPRGYSNFLFSRLSRKKQEVYFSNMKRLGILDIDIMQGFGPENYTVHSKYKGKYKIFVKYYSAHGVNSDVNYTVTVNNRGKIEKFKGKYTRRDVGKKDHVFTLDID